ncbi:DNA starvation/stationary phase protection protein DpsA [Halegenticoccus soli]|uniref:DNA starvation/stationary phase protection protein DpsA n=1 Tax=Halegenticoccus soli TaxID=1985678 RepID=UPI000C6E5F0D|nr:DNA starvation/stationary phase protection protein DpsA [Halegenticoccus soli]
MAKRQIGLVREPDTGELRQEWGTVVENELGIDRDVAEVVVGALRVDHAGTFNLFYLLRKHYWTAEGAEFHQVAEFLGDAYKRARAINDDLAVRIVELGGVPPNTPPTIQENARVHLEAEDVYDLRASLEGDLEGYATLVAEMRDHVGLAEELGDWATAKRLHDHLRDLEDDARAVEQLLEGDALVREGATD